MKLRLAVASLLLLSSDAFTPPCKACKASKQSATKLSMAGLTVGIVGATGAVGQEILSVLEKRQDKLQVGEVRLFSSARSAGKTQDSLFGSLTLQEFTRAKARECDVVFLAVSGDFALEHAKALIEGDDGCVCIDNSVRSLLVCRDYAELCCCDDAI
jgi:predicted amino acid dehydrogenase